MDLIRVVEDFRQWAARYFDSALTILLAGRLRRPLVGFFANDAVWIFIGQDTVGAGTTLLCWCSADLTIPTPANCRRLDSGFTAFDGVPIAQGLLGTQDFPSLIISGERGVDSRGRAFTWLYVFPMPDTLTIVAVQQRSPLEFEATLWHGQLDTADLQQQFPFYVRSTVVPAPPLVDSDWTIAWMKERPEFQTWLREHEYERAILVGGVPLPLRGPWQYGWYLTVASQDGASMLRCWHVYNASEFDIVFNTDCTIVGVQEEASDGVIVAPNPASDFVLVQAPGVARIRLKGSYTLLGERVELPTVSLSADMLLLDVRSLPSGVYTLSIELGNQLLRSQLRVVR